MAFHSSLVSLLPVRGLFCLGDLVNGSDRNQGEGRAAKRLAIGIAFGSVVLKNRRHRRNALFGLTLLTLLLVFGGTVFLGDGLMKSPIAFLLFWGLCFLLVGLVLMLALYDLLAVRKEHRRRVRDLESQLATAAEEARRKAAEEENPSQD